MKKYKILLMTITILSVVFLSACSKENKEVKNTNEQSKIPAKVYPLISSDKPIGKFAGDFVWEQNGKQIRFSEYTKGKYVLLNFWGTWCPPCRRELPDLIAIAKAMESKGLVVIGAAWERTPVLSEAISSVSDFWVSNHLYYTNVIATEELIAAYGGINAVPTTFLINTKGEIVKSFEGALSKEAFMSEINLMMK